MKCRNPTVVLAVGVDSSKFSHCLVAMKFPEQILLEKQVPNRPDAIEKIDVEINQMAEAQGLEVIYGLEDSQTYGRVFSDCLLPLGRDLREVNPLKSNRQKDFYGQDKADPIDAQAIAVVVLRCCETLPQVVAPDAILASIRETERHLWILTRQKTQNLNKLHMQLTQVYGGCYKEFFANLDSGVALQFFHTYPTPQILNRASRSKLAHFLYKSSKGRLRRHSKHPDPKVRAKQTAEVVLSAVKCFQTEPANPVLRLKATLIQQLCQLVITANEAIDVLVKKLDTELLPRSGQKLRTLKGIATIQEARILGEILTPDRFHSRHAFAKYNGTAPAKDASGIRHRHRARKACNHRLKLTFYFIALSAATHDPISRAYYEHLLSKGMPKKEALKRVARRLSDIVYAMLKTKSAYNPRIALASMERRRTQMAA